MMDGEPLLSPDWDRLAGYLTHRGIEVAVITNGALLDDAAVERASAAGVSMFAISVDAVRRLTVPTQPITQPVRCPSPLAMSGLDPALFAACNPQLVAALIPHGLESRPSQQLLECACLLNESW